MTDKEFYQQWKEDSKARKKKRAALLLERAEANCTGRTKLSPYHWRKQTDKGAIDFWPSTDRIGIQDPTSGEMVYKTGGYELLEKFGKL